MPFTKINKVEYWERQGYSEGWQVGRNEASRTIAVDWNKRRQLVNEFLGVNAVIGKALSRQVPETHPDAPWLPCVSMTLLNPEGAVRTTDDVTGKFDFRFRMGSPNESIGLAIYRVAHATVPYLIYDDQQMAAANLGEKERFTWVEEKVAGASQKTLGDTYTVVGAPRPIPEPGALLYFTREVTVHWYAVPGWDRTAIEELFNKVNQNAWTIREFTYAAETLLFCGYETEEKRDQIGQRLKDLRFRFLWNPFGHNNYWRPRGPVAGQGPGYYPVVAVADPTKKPYQPDATGFDGLFTVSAPFGG